MEHSSKHAIIAALVSSSKICTPFRDSVISSLIQAGPAMCDRLLVNSRDGMSDHAMELDDTSTRRIGSAMRTLSRFSCKPSSLGMLLLA